MSQEDLLASLKQRSSRLSLSMQPAVHLLEHKLKIVSVSKESLSSVTHSLLNVLLKLFSRDSNCRRNHFFSFTETCSDYSIVLDSELLKAVQVGAPESNNIEVVDVVWRPLVVEIGAFGSLSGIGKIAASVITPLADHGVSVFCLSTNQDDYVLVKEADLKKALSCLSIRFKVMCDSERTSDTAVADGILKKANMECSKRIGSCAAVATPPQPHPRPQQHRPITHPYTCSSTQFSVCSVAPNALTSSAVILLEFMLFNKYSKEDVFFSISIIDNDITMVIDSKELSRFPEDALYSSEECWRLLRIGDSPLGFEECGIVAQVSAPLAEAEISTYYICTYYTDHTLVQVPCESVEKALHVLNDRTFLLHTFGAEETPSDVHTTSATTHISNGHFDVAEAV